VSDKTFFPALPAAQLPAGQMRCVEISGRLVLLAHAKDGIYALDNLCSHGHARMDEGRLRGHRLICPLHAASFDVRTGAVLGGAATQALPSHPVRIVDGQIEVQL